jgi:16S rRNA (guanine966-N2)-methyltransferase
MDVRPLRGRLREALFSILAPALPEARVLDLFAGTGAIGIEALSRGADFALFVEQRAVHARLIKENLAAMGLPPESWRVHRGAAPACFWMLADAEDLFDIVYSGAPYNRGLTAPVLEALGSKGAATLLSESAIIVAETHSREVLAERFGALTLYRRKSYGITTFWFYSRET